MMSGCFLENESGDISFCLIATLFIEFTMNGLGKVRKLVF